MASQLSQEEEEAELFDTECLKLMNEYYFEVRIFPGQDPSHVFVRWVTTQYHYHANAFSQSKVRKVTIAGIDEYEAEK